MFQFPDLPPRILFYSDTGCRILLLQGCPIQIPTDQSLQRLPVAFRCLLRLSSAAGA